MCSIVNQSTARKSDQSEVAISGRLTNQKPGKRTNQKAGYKKKQPIDKRAETRTSFDMSRKSKSKDQTNKGNNKITKLRTILQRESQNS